MFTFSSSYSDLPEKLVDESLKTGGTQRSGEMNNHVCVVGVGMTPFVKPGANEPYTMMGVQAVKEALEDARAGLQKCPASLCWVCIR